MGGAAWQNRGSLVARSCGAADPTPCSSRPPATHQGVALGPSVWCQASHVAELFEEAEGKGSRVLVRPQSDMLGP